MKTARIVLGDSHRVMQRGLTTLLEPTHQVVATADDAASLLDAVSLYQPDLVIVDVSLPNDGRGVLSRLRESDSSVKILMVSVYDEHPIVKKAFEAGASAFVLKRSAASDLIPAIERVLAGGTYLSPELQRQMSA